MNPLRRTQLAWGLLAAVAFAAAGLVDAAWLPRRPRYTRGEIVETLLEVLPGRAFLVTYWWIRADRMKEEGRYYDAMQQARLICGLQRKFPGVWSFHSWNMAWNISVATHTPEERWRWVYNGLRLLRDEGIPLNPRSITLYKDLGWIFLFKMGDYLDDMHWVYKRQWAMRMQDLLGAPPEGTTEEALAAFRPVAEAPLDRSPERQGRRIIQPDKLAELLKDPQLKACADALAEVGVGVDQKLLAAYNRYSLDEAVSAVRIAPPKPQTPEALAISEAINAPKHAEARRRLLAFVRAQILWNLYRMDPRRMLSLMERFGPLDWRLPQPHAIYWLQLGRDVCGHVPLSNIDALNTQRNLFICLKQLTWRGRLTLIDLRPRSAGQDVLSLEPVQAESQMDLPNIQMRQLPDLRFVETTQAEYLRVIDSITGGNEKRFKSNKLRNGHINYLADAVKMLYTAYKRRQAQELLDWIREHYAPKGLNWMQRDVRDFVLYELRHEPGVNRDLAENLAGTSLLVGLIALARGDSECAQESIRFAREVHRAYQAGRGERMRLPDFESYLLTAAEMLLANPRGVGYNLSLLDRSELYRALDPGARKAVYERIQRRLKQECRMQEMDFEKAFPPPPERRDSQTPWLDQSIQP